MSGIYNIVAPLARTAKAFPDRTAIVSGEGTLTYGVLTAQASKLAAVLTPLLKTRRIGILGSRSLDAYVGIAGAAWAGAAYVPLNLKWPEERLIALMSDLDLDALVVDSNGAALLTQAVRDVAPPIFAISSEAEKAGVTMLDDLPDHHLPEPVQRTAREIGYIVFTSGSTGMPKGVVVSCGSLATYLEQTRRWANFMAGDRIAEAHDVTFDLSVHNMFLTFEAGSTLYVMSALDMMAPHGFIRRHAITCWMSVPTVVNTMRRAGRLKPDLLPSLRLSVFCGEPLAMPTVLDWAAAAPNSVIENIYGPTECTVVCTRQRLTADPIVTKSRNILAIGEPYANFTILITDADGNELPDGQTGEIVLKSEQLSDGYFNAPELTAKAFRTIDGERCYFTGDLGVRDENGILHHMGRADNQVKMKGNRIELEEVETHLRRACGSDLACVVAWPVLDGAVQGLVAFVSGSELSADEIRNQMRRTLPDYMVPQTFRSLEALPENINGKIDRKALFASLDEEVETATIAPSSEGEAAKVQVQSA